MAYRVRYPSLYDQSRITVHVTKFQSNRLGENDNEFTVHKFPPQSPDINLVEQVWDHAVMSTLTIISEEYFQRAKRNDSSFEGKPGLEKH